MICNTCRKDNYLALIVAHGDGLPIMSRCEMCGILFAFQKTHGLDYRNLLPKNKKRRGERSNVHRDHKDDWLDVNEVTQKDLRSFDLVAGKHSENH